MDDDNCPLNLALHNALVVELVRIVVDESEVLVLVQGVLDAKVGNLTTRHTGKAVGNHVAEILLCGCWANIGEDGQENGQKDWQQHVALLAKQIPKDCKMTML